jgi:hypothetical protein
MALIVNIDLPNGINLVNSYAKVEHVVGTKEQIIAYVNFYATLESYKAGKDYVCRQEYGFVPALTDGSENYHKQAYEYLKTLPSFSSAIDI